MLFATPSHPSNKVYIARANSSTQNLSAACTVEAAALAMANHRAAAALLLIASLFMAVAISRADARPTVRRDAHGQGMQLHTPTRRPSNHPA